MYKTRKGAETIVDLPVNMTEYIIKGLLHDTSYTVSVLAYTIGDGPRSIHLTATTNDINICKSNIILCIHTYITYLINRKQK